MAEKARGSRMAKSKSQFKGKKNHQNYADRDVNAKDKWKEKIFHDYKKLKRKEDKQPQAKHIKELIAADESEAPGPSSSSQPSPSHSQSTESSNQATSSSKQKSKEMKQVSRFSKAQWEHKERAEKKQQKHEEMLRKKQEKDAAIEQYRRKKKDKFLKLCKRTPKGQPVMKYQMHFLLEKLEKQHKDRTKAASS